MRSAVIIAFVGAALAAVVDGRRSERNAVPMASTTSDYGPTGGTPVELTSSDYGPTGGTPVEATKDDTNSLALKDRLRLFDKLTKDYNRLVYPSAPNVTLGLGLIDVHIDEGRSTVESNVWMRMTWYDSRLKWDPSDYGIGVLRMEYHLLWHPDIALYNSADLSSAATACWESNVLVYPDGKVFWVPPCHFSSFCKLTLRSTPYEPQNCFLKFGSWTHDSNTVDLNLYQNTASIDTADFWDLSDWKVVSTSAQKNVKRYDCCPEPYADLTFNITLRRKPPADSVCAV